MIVNVNPYDTGFDENSQVMKFSAIAREVSTITPKAPLNERRRTVRLSLVNGSGQKVPCDALFDVLEGMSRKTRPWSAVLTPNI